MVYLCLRAFTATVVVDFRLSVLLSIEPTWATDYRFILFVSDFGKYIGEFSIFISPASKVIILYLKSLRRVNLPGILYMTLESRSPRGIKSRRFTHESRPRGVNSNFLKHLHRPVTGQCHKNNCGFVSYILTILRQRPHFLSWVKDSIFQT